MVGESYIDCGESTDAIATPTELMQLLKEQEYCCALSGLPLTPVNAVLDHVQPVSSCGDDTIQNLQWLEKRINRMKGTLSQSEFVSLCQLVVKHDGSSANL